MLGNDGKARTLIRPHLASTGAAAFARALLTAFSSFGKRHFDLLREPDCDFFRTDTATGAMRMVQPIAIGEGTATSDGRVEDLVAKFPETIVLLPSRSKWRAVLLGSLRMGVVVAWVGQPFGEAFFGLCTIMAVLLPRRSSLTLDENGF